ncbi:unnamed protein product [Trichobilharzia regenti]|uniref:Ubiquitin-conjugating enzyme E2C-binding protein n=1 Tax=Trichobilharzia regenti TaxID=157069 RepID=A0A183VMH2_TRIRE|nr:unnamed protein product [Trichobilharzia regenti]VDP97557.1 unnamed protein product [Trichobilharzia regenti]
MDPLPIQCPLPISTTMPSYSKLNHRRRITCNICGLPFGYVTMSTAYIESNLNKLYEINKEIIRHFIIPGMDNNTTEMTIEQKQRLVYEHLKTEQNVNNNSNDNSHSNNQNRILRENLNVHETDNRYFMAIFLQDAINIHVKPRSSRSRSNDSILSSEVCLNQRSNVERNKQIQDKIDEAFIPVLPHILQLNDKIHHAACNVLCAGCNTVIGVRYIPRANHIGMKPASLLLKEYIKERNATTHNATDTNPYITNMNSSDFKEFTSYDLPEWGCEIPSVTSEDDGWITISLQCVSIQPLFSLIGLDQFSIRYQGVELMPRHYHSIESSNEFSQNSETWMYPTRRIDKSCRLGKHREVGWSKTFYDLERLDKTVPYSMVYGDLITGTIRRLYDIYPEKKIIKITSQ